MDSIEDYNPIMDNMEEWRHFWCTLAHFHVEFAPIYNWDNNNEKSENDYMFFYVFRKQSQYNEIRIKHAKSRTK
jgi:hypothetical protein